jgi:[acyl-carrier-protein] S-malonyltransferase
MPQTAFLFPGQGAQALGMGKQLCETLPAARRLFDEAAEVLGYDLAAVCWNGPVERLNSTAVSQPALFVASLAALESLKASDPAAVANCSGAAGLSLGEYTALTFAGAMSFRDGLRVVKVRGDAMQKASDANPSGMVSVVGPEVPQVEELVKKASPAGFVQVANFLCPGNTVVSGTLPAVAEVERLAKEGGTHVIRLAVAGAFHTALMKPADEALAQVLNEVEIKAPRLPVWSNVDGQPHKDPAEIRSLLVKQVLQPVLWEKSVRNLLAAGFDKFYEIGPGRVLAGLLKRVQRKIECQNVLA